MEVSNRQKRAFTPLSFFVNGIWRTAIACLAFAEFLSFLPLSAQWAGNVSL